MRGTSDSDYLGNNNGYWTMRMDPERPRAATPIAGPAPLRRIRSQDGSPRVLLLTSGLGLGHVRAAQAIEVALKQQGAVARTLDLWSFMNPGVAQAVHQTYLRLVQQYPDLYERLYQLDEHSWRQVLESEDGPPEQVLEVLQLISGLAADACAQEPRGGKYASDRVLLSLLRTTLAYDGDSLAGTGVRARLALMKWSWLRLIRRLEPAIAAFAPDVLLSTQMIPAAMVSWLKQRGRLRMPLVGVLTDFGAHDFWNQPGVDRYCVAHVSVAASLMAHGARSVATTGVPLMPGFGSPPSQQEARRELRLPQDAPTVLVLGGGLGLNVDNVAARLLARSSELRLLVMRGRGPVEGLQLNSLAAADPSRVHVHAWTERMEAFIRAADLVVGKPGGITLAEVLACGRPLLATRSLGGQEGFNVRFLERHGVGGLVADDELFDRVQHLLGNRGPLLQMQRQAWLLGRRDGALRIAQLVLELAPAMQVEIVTGSGR